MAPSDPVSCVILQRRMNRPMTTNETATMTVSDTTCAQTRPYMPKTRLNRYSIGMFSTAHRKTASAVERLPSPSP